MSDTIVPSELRDAAARALEANRAAGRRVAVAESCTGGLVTAALTEVAGSSDVVEAGFVTYSNEAKQAMLGVAPDLLDTFGAVSSAVAWAMAQGALARSGADVAVAVTGVAGPGGGTAKKPVGTVMFARAERGADPAEVHAVRRDFGPAFEMEGRAGVRRQAALCALELLMPGSPPSP